MKILRASAGSGKTYRLSKAYIGLLLSSGQKDAYRHILAVTFTNKATEEMKERILDDLYRLSSENPRARELLVTMLHDYGSFSVSTIDHFFQRTLKAFSREIGQFADYQIELDRKSLIQEAMDRILDSLTPDDRELVRWISGSLEGSLERGSELDIEGSLYDMGSQLKSEECGKLAESLGIDMLAEYSKDRLERLGKACAELRDSFIDALRNAGLEDVSRSERFRLEGRKRALKKLPGAMEVVEEGFRAYNTACEIGDRIFSLGFAGEFYSAFDALLREKNVMCLDESNLLLRDIIGDSDAPFIYEKVGVRYDSFLLDEFQDTSNVQWDNFLPLLRESESRGGHNLIVGDVKQSIYRFRDSDWSLLASGVLEAFPDAEVVDQKFLRPHHVLNRDDRKIHAVGFSRVGIDGTRPCRAGTPPENVAADDEVFLRVKRTSRADHLVPPAGLPVIFVVTARQMRVPCQRMFHKNGVACIRIQGPIGLITDVQIAQTPSAVQLQPGVGMEILRRHNADGRFCFWFRFFTHCNLPALRCVIW